MTALRLYKHLSSFLVPTISARLRLVELDDGISDLYSVMQAAAEVLKLKPIRGWRACCELCETDMWLICIEPEKAVTINAPLSARGANT